MSITRLQQARQMYAMGQRVAKTLDGSRPGYRGSDMASVGTSTRAANTSQKDTSGADYGGGNQGRDAATSSGAVDRSSDTQQYNHNEAMEQNTGIKNPLRPAGVDPGFIKPEDATNLGFNLRPYEQQRVDFLDTPYEPVNIPPFVPGGTLINTVGNFLGGLGAKKNRQFFADNVAGKYGFGYDMNAYKDYMRRRMAGEIGAYGNEEQGFNNLNASGRDDGIMGITNGTEGIMDINNVGDATADDTTTDVDFFSRYLQNQPEDIRKAIEAKMKNYYTV